MYLEDVTRYVDAKTPVDTINQDFRNAFDTVRINVWFKRIL